MPADLRVAFQNLLLSYSQEADLDKRTSIEAQLWAGYGTEQAVLVFDMSGFSSLSSRYGIVHYLSMVRRMQLTAEPLVTAERGVMIKFEADNGFAIFSSVTSAIKAAWALNDAFERANVDTPEELDIRIGCGIDYGEILVVGGRDFFGDAVNRACKLGEDLALPGEVLLTRRAAERLPTDFCALLEPVILTISGILIEAVYVRAVAS